MTMTIFRGAASDQRESTGLRFDPFPSLSSLIHHDTQLFISRFSFLLPSSAFGIAHRLVAHGTLFSLLEGCLFSLTLEILRAREEDREARD